MQLLFRISLFDFVYGQSDELLKWRLWLFIGGAGVWDWILHLNLSKSAKCKFIITQVYKICHAKYIFRPIKKAFTLLKAPIKFTMKKCIIIFGKYLVKLMALLTHFKACRRHDFILFASKSSLFKAVYRWNNK